jgi:allantoicase
MNNDFSSSFAGLTELASEKVGGKVLLASDDFFAEKENLIKAEKPVFIHDKYTDRGKWMDGWESRRKRVAGFDWCILKLGIAGFIKGVDIDTSFFIGNYPPYASLEACFIEGNPSNEDLLNANWVEILSKSSLNPGTQNLFSCTNTDKAWTHLKLNIFPDGGVARLRVYGDVLKKIPNDGSLFELSALVNGAKVIVCNDMFFGNKDNMIAPGRAKNMGDGWETRRKRIIEGPDWSIIKLANKGSIKELLIDTNHFKGNYPDSCSVEGIYAPDLQDIDFFNPHKLEWTEILPKSKLEGHKEHKFTDLKNTNKVFTHLKLNIFPDGGISRFRAFGNAQL